MREQLISFETAKLAKEKGFDLNQKNWYDQIGGLNPRKGASGSMCYENIGYAPTQSLLQKWLREEHKTRIEMPFFSIDNTYCSCIYFKKDKLYFDPNISYNTYEEALEAGLKKALELIPVS